MNSENNVHPVKDIINGLSSVPSSTAMKMQQIVEEITGYPTEIAPIVIPESTLETMRSATTQWARASRQLLTDVYSNIDNKFHSIPGLKHVVESSPYYARELIEWGVPSDFQWNFTTSLDWQFTHEPNSLDSIQIIEVNAGSIGGLDRSAFVFYALRKLWESEVSFEYVIDGVSSLQNLLNTCSSVAQNNSGLSVVFQENDQASIYGPDSDHIYNTWLRQNGATLISNWNSHLLQYDANSNCYTYQGKPIGNFLLQYYPVAIDRNTQSYANLSEIYKTEYEQSHNVDGFWCNYYKNMGYKKWHVFNPLGVDLLNDKALLAYYNDIIRLYLAEEPVVPLHSYVFCDASSLSNVDNFIDNIFNNQDSWVVKSRRENREGLGVFVGRYLRDNPDSGSFNWNDLKEIVRLSPQGFAFQKFLDEPMLTLPDGRVRSYEVRNFSWTHGNNVTAFDVPYVRCSPPGSLRNLSRKDGASIVPVFMMSP